MGMRDGGMEAGWDMQARDMDMDMGMGMGGEVDMGKGRCRGMCRDRGDMNMGGRHGMRGMRGMVGREDAEVVVDMYRRRVPVPVRVRVDRDGEVVVVVRVGMWPGVPLISAS